MMMRVLWQRLPLQGCMGMDGYPGGDWGPGAMTSKLWGTDEDLGLGVWAWGTRLWGLRAWGRKPQNLPPLYPPPQPHNPHIPYNLPHSPLPSKPYTLHTKTRNTNRPIPPTKKLPPPYPLPLKLPPAKTL